MKSSGVITATWTKRSLFYWGREYTRSLEQRQDYNELPNMVAINIVN
ncbi:MAG: Rpn family recombination-promoting nuclease/putative transposase [Treponema sp.]|nr:Rpn family recombination-promoting nuclease/putative transposase [Treponema sp.]